MKNYNKFVNMKRPYFLHIFVFEAQRLGCEVGRRKAQIIFKGDVRGTHPSGFPIYCQFIIETQEYSPKHLRSSIY